MISFFSRLIPARKQFLVGLRTKPLLNARRFSQPHLATSEQETVQKYAYSLGRIAETCNSLDSLIQRFASRENAFPVYPPFVIRPMLAFMKRGRSHDALGWLQWMTKEQSVKWDADVFR